MNRTIFYTLIATVFFIQMHHHYAAEVNQPAINDGYTRSLIVRAENGDSLELLPADLATLRSEYLKQLAAPEHELSVESIAVLPIATLRSLQLLLPGSQLTEAQYDDVVEATSLADLLVIPNGVDHFLKRLGRENIKLLCQLYQDPGLEGQELVKDYIIPYLPYKLTQRLGAVDNTGDHLDIGHTDVVASITLSPDGNTIISGSYDHTIIVWHRGEDGLFHMVQRLGVVGNTGDHPDVGHTAEIISITLSSDGNTIISSSVDRTLIVWRRGEDGQFRFNPQRDRLGVINNTEDHPDVGHTDLVSSIALSPDGNTIISGSGDHTVIIWRRGEDGQFRFNPQRDRLGVVGNIDFNIGHTDWVRLIELSPDGDTIISYSNDHTLIVWRRGEDGQFRFDSQRGRLGAVNIIDTDPDAGHTSLVCSGASLPDDNTIVSGSADRTLIVWRRGEDGQFRFNPQRDRLGAVDNEDAAIGHTGLVSSIALSPDGNTIISGSGDHTVIIWQRQSVDEFCAGHMSNKRRRLI